MFSHTPQLLELALRLAALPAEKRALFRQRLRERGIDAAQLPILPVQSRPAALPLSCAQQRLWFLQQLEPDSAAYNLPGALRIDGALDLDALRSAFDALLRRHEALRTGLVEREGRAEQVVAAEVAVTLPVVDLRPLDPAAREAELQRRLGAEADRPFDLAQPPLLRLSLLRLSDREQVLLVTLHHLIADGLSLGVLIRELAEHYGAARQGSAAALPPLPIQYADYALWQQDWLDDEALAPQLDYWRQQLGSEPPVLELPTDRPRPPRASGRGERLRFALDPALTAALRRLARAQGVTPFMLLHAVFALLLYKLSGQRDLRVGVPVANRARLETENLIGFLVNTQVLRSELRGALRFSELLQQVRAAALAAQTHADLPFERLVEALQPQRDLSRTPLFQVMFNHQQLPAKASGRFADLAMQVLPLQRGTTQFDLSLDLIERGEALEGLFSYSSDLFEAVTVERFARYYQQLLRAVTERPDAALAQLSMLAEREDQQLTREWNTGAACAPIAFVHTRFEAQAAATPEAIALIHDEVELSYAELNARANRLAHRLLAAGLRPETRVGLLVERSVELVVALLAVLKAGGVYVPLDPAYPAERLAYMLDDAGIALLLCQASMRERIDLGARRVLDVADAEGPAHNPDTSVWPQQLAYLMYTSGSTGRPKGVGIDHAALAAHAEVAREFFGLAPGERMLQFATFNFDGFVEQLYPALACGATVVLRGPELWDSEELYRRIHRHRLTVMDLTTAYWFQVVQDWAVLGVRDYGALRQVNVGGEAMPPEGIGAWQKAGLQALRLLNTYGPTEATVTATLYDCAGVVAGERPLPAQMPIGLALGGRALYIVDADANSVPVGVAGELCIGGPLLARGYHDRPELTAERFLPDSFGEPGARLYRTGDLARWRADGLIEYVGRVDHQVKIRGFRIELAEIEARLLAHGAIREALVLAREDRPGDTRLVAYVVVRDEAINAEALRSHLKEILPDYMLPAAFVFLPQIPLTPNGKLDRRALPAPDYDANESYVAPRNATEASLAKLWAELLGVERVGIHDNFFALGGHSLLATRLVSRLRRELSCELPVRALFEAPTIAGLAERLPAAHENLAPIPVVSRERPLPLSFSQQRLWFLQQLEPGSAAYNMPGALRLVGALDVAALRAAFSALVQRHESLRTTFHGEAGDAVQRIAAAIELPLTLQDLSHLDADARATEVQRLADGEAQQPFDLSAGPLLRLRLLKLADAEHLLLVTLHHIIADGWSLAVLTREFAEAYAAARRGESPRWAPLPIQYADYAAWQRQQLDGPALQPQLDYWTAQLGFDPPLLELPTDRPRQRLASGRGGTLRRELDPALGARLRALAQGQGATLFMTLLTVFDVLLYKLTGQRDLRVGVPVAQRPRCETEHLIGFFVNTQVLRAQLDGAQRFDELLQQTRETALAAQAHADLPFERLVEVLQPERDLARTPLFQVMFNWVPAEASALPLLPGLRLEPLAQQRGTTQFELSLDVIERAQGLELLWTYSSDVFDAATIERYAGYYLGLLEAASRQPQAPLAALSMLPVAEAQQLTRSWNRGGECPPAALVHERIQAQAAANPRAIALVLDDQALSYAELDARAGQLAQCLIAAGVGAETRVAVCLERSLELAVALLAVLKAGGAYLPLDPAYPPERLHYILRDAGVRVLLSRPAIAAGLGTADLRVLDVAAPVPAPRPQPLPAVHPAQLAYLIYTSGSTGQPKGVGISHAALAAHAEIARDYLGLGREDRVLQFASVSFDAFVEQFFPALVSGAAVVLRGSQLWDSETLYLQIRSQGITVADLPTAYWAQVIQDFAQRGPRDYGRWRLATVGGEAMLPQALSCWREAGLADVRLLNAYGPTEATVTATLHDCAAEVAGERPLPAQMPIGQALGGRALYILDADANPVPLGVAGELCIGGPLLARGYHDRPELTAERFLPDPYGEPGARLYRSGDLARWRADGLIEYLGRVDHQVKIRGFRIELAEIEARLLAHGAIREALVLAREDRPGDTRLVAYVVAARDVAIDAEALRLHLQQTLPDYMLPAVFVFLAAIPLTPNGKLDRRALPAPDYESGDAHVAPRNATEQILAGLWAELLGVERVGIHDNFFALGGHSLLATRLVSRLRRELSCELPVRALFEAPTIAGLVQRLPTATAELAPIPAVSRDQLLPLSFAQQRLWFLQQLEPESSAYNMPAALRLQGELRLPALQTAFDALVARHEVLRTRYRDDNGEARQWIAPPAPVPLPLVDLSALDGDVREARARALAAAEARRPFDLTRDAPLRLQLLRLDEREHLLLATLHHIAADAGSLVLMTRELAQHYAAAMAGAPASLPPLPIQYADYAVWQRQHLDGAALQAQLDYWTSQLGREQPPLELPLDRPRPKQASGAGAAHRFVIEPALRARLEALGRERGASLFMSLFAVFALLLQRLSGQRDVRVGVPIAQRPRLETEDLIGFFVNTQVLRTRLDTAQPFSALLQQVRAAALGAQTHADLPFERLVERLQPERDLSRTPLFQVMFNLLQGQNAAPELPGLSLQPWRSEDRSAAFDLSLDLVERGAALEAVFTYSTDVFDGATVERFAGYYLNLLQAVTERPEAPLAQLPMLDARETRRLTREWNSAEIEIGGALAPVHERFEAQVEATPETIALVLDDEQLSYAALNARANRLAHRLLAAGVTPDTRVGVLVERSVELVVALLAVLKAGGAYVPLDPAYPAERLAYMLDDAGIELLLSQAAVVERAGLDLRGRRVIDAADAAAPAHNPWLAVQPQQLAYLMYTSGSTGRPKGVGIAHAALAAHARVARDFFGLAPGERMLQFATFNFDGFVEQLYPALLCGATVVLRGPELWDSEELYRRIHRHRITVMDLTTAYWFQVVQDWATLGARDYASLRQVNVGGEAMPPEGISAWQKAGLQAVRLLNTYGPTEATVTATLYDCAGEVAGARTIPTQMPIGQALGGRALQVLDADANPVPVGVVGELCIGGALLARGYHGRPELTAERFLPDPFGLPGARLYRTGDLARWRADGLIEYVGRVDHQVKIRGFRIELAEIEARLLAHGAIREALVLVREDSPGDMRLVAYVVAAREAAITTEALRTHLQETLPDYMLPGAFVFLPQIPLTPNGKLDRRALPAPDHEAGDDAYVAPRTPTEATLATLWAELLNVPRVGIHDNFFALGGHSLLATRLVSRLRRELSCELPIRALFEAPTIAELAGRLPAGGGLLAPIPVVARERPLPLSFAQQRLWFLQQMEPDSSAYNLPLAVRLAGALDIDALRQAVAALVARHEVLRTHYHEQQGEPLQLIAAHSESDWSVVDLSDLAGAEQAEAARRLACEQRETPFDLTRDPMLRVQLLKLGQAEHVLLATVHHIAADGWGLAVMIRELAALYAAFREQRPDPLAPLPIQYADFAVWQRQWLSGAELERQLGYWTQQLGAELPVLELPGDRPRPPVASGHGGHCRWTLAPETLARLQGLAQAQGASLFMLLLAAFDVWLYAHSGRLDPVVGTDIANRHRAETEGLLGFFVNQLALKADLAGNPGFRELLLRTRRQVLDAYAHQDLPFERLVEALNPARSLAHTPLFQVKLVLQNQAEERLVLPGLEVLPEPIEHDQAEFDLLLVISEGANGLDGLLRYRSDLFDADTASAYARQYVQVLERCAAEPDARIDALAREVVEQARAARLARQQAQATLSLGRLQGARRKYLVSLKDPVETPQ